MTQFEIDCLRPFFRAMADYERWRLIVFREALQLLVRGRQRNRPLLEEWVVGDGNLVLWVFNVVTRRSWVYDDHGEDDDTAGEDYEDYEELEAKR